MKLYLVFLIAFIGWRYVLLPKVPDTVPSVSSALIPPPSASPNTVESFVSARGGVEFMNAKTTAEFLLNDADTYVQSMSKSDLTARKVVCQEAYRLNAYFASQDFNPDQQALLRRATGDADAFFESYVPASTASTASTAPSINSIKVIAYFDAKKAIAIPWRFMMVGEIYEEGLPHTRESYIFLSPKVLSVAYDELVETLIHEKIHLYQRKYRREKTYLDYEKTEVFLTDYMLTKMNYERLRKRSESTCDLRANPDVDEWIYRDPKNSREMMLCFRSSQPTGINDVIGDAKDEHPFERIAYEIAQLYRNRHKK